MRGPLVAVVYATLCVLVSAVEDIAIEYADTANRMAGQEVKAVAPASTSSSAWKFDVTFSDSPSSGGQKLAQSAQNRYAVVPILSNSGYIKARSGPGHSSGSRLPAAKVTQLAGKFVNPDGSVLYAGGTSWFNIMQIGRFSEPEITQILQQHYQHGVRVMRAFGHNDGYGTIIPVTTPIQPRVGVFSEVALQRYDFVLDALSKAGIRITLTMTNHWPEYGGFAWYTQQVLGGGAAPELFYSNGRVLAAFQTWLKKLATRVNTVNGRRYSQDPTIFSWQLCNECHTSNNYERNSGIQPGSLLYHWLKVNSKFLKSLGVKQMVSIGSDGYRSRGKYDPTASVTGPHVNWMNSGLKGEDFVRNLGIKTLDFATIHVYPSNWGIPASEYRWVNDNYIGDRASLTAANGKPLMLEEYGMPRGYMPSRDTLFDSELAAAHRYGAAGTLAWEVWTLSPRSDSNYDFTYFQDGGTSTRAMLTRQVARTESVARPAPRPVPRPAPRPVTRPVSRPVSRPAPRPVAQPTPVPTPSVCLITCGIGPIMPAKPTVPMMQGPVAPFQPKYEKDIHKHAASRLKNRLAKEAYLRSLSAYGLILGAHNKSKARYPALLAAYNKAAIAASKYHSCTLKCSPPSMPKSSPPPARTPTPKASPTPTPRLSPTPTPRLPITPPPTSTSTSSPIPLIPPSLATSPTPSPPPISA